MALKLYFSPGACSLAAHIALEEAGADYETELIAVHRGETQSARYLKVNARGRVPALDVDGEVLTETCAILFYIARLFPTANLLPASPIQQARCLSNMAWIAGTVHPAFAHIMKPERFVDDISAHAAIKETATRSYWTFLQEVDAIVAAGPWYLGHQFTLCDAYALPFWGFGRRIRLPMQDLRHFTAWKNRMLTRPAVLGVLKKEGSRLLDPQ